MGVVRSGFGDSPLGLAERPFRGFGSLRQGFAHSSDQKAVGLLIQRKRGALARSADHPAGGRGESAQPLKLAAGHARGELRQDARRQQQLEPKRQSVGRPSMHRLGTQQRQLVAEQPEYLRVGLRALEQPSHRIAGTGRGIERLGLVAEPGMRVDGVDTGHGVQVTAALVEDDADLEEGLEPSTEPAARTPDALGNRPKPAVARRVQVEDPVRFAVPDRAQHERFGLQRTGHAPPGMRLRRGAPVAPTTSEIQAIFTEVMKSVTVYTTDHCSLCVSAKKLLEKRGIDYEEINLARDADSRERLSRVTGMFTFPQIVIDENVIGGFAELLAADREGRLGDLLAA